MNTNIRSKVYSHGEPFRRVFFMEDNNIAYCNRDGTKEYHVLEVTKSHPVTGRVQEYDTKYIVRADDNDHPEIQAFLKTIQYLPTKD
ncbi:hypothetical protein [Enterobacter hormaechei]|uniref:hypothetical protein n=1 Tax=Enterobacter hormaechei TaxID=158836 RepID=UPI001E3485E9|nr:hypothetical protein [Enterobacter hormaechei]MCC4525052.1 hypothetical protein [Enterobacter hormaechei]MCC4529137.1 hypothetical protein [Enterobacter hormaechei]MCC4534381.1 hypothetical protein [Enterobacter hormaechei]MCC4538757.1 hypothetical protein [Enterobacter hormaechei]